MDRQEATFTAWVNAVLAPSTAEPSNAAMARLAARTRGWLWSMYQADAGLQDVMVRVEARIDTGQLRIGSEVGAGHGALANGVVYCSWGQGMIRGKCPGKPRPLMCWSRVQL